MFPGLHKTDKHGPVIFMEEQVKGTIDQTNVNAQVNNTANKPNKSRILVYGGIVLAVLVLLVPVMNSMVNNKHEKNLSVIKPSISAAPMISKAPITATALLAFQKETATSTAILMDTGDKAATAVQLEISFDPTMIKDMTVTPGNFFEKTLVLMSNIDYNNGSIFYAMVVPPGGAAKLGKGVIATMSYSFASETVNPANFRFLPRTKVVAVGINQSVLKEAKDTSLPGE